MMRVLQLYYLTVLACLDKLKIVWKEYRVAKKEAGSLWAAFIENKITRKAHDRKVTTENMVKMLKKELRSIQEGVESRQIRGRNDKQPVMKAEITYFITGITTTVYTQEEIVIAAAAELNLLCQSQTIGTAFRQPAFFNTFGQGADNKDNCFGVLDGTFVPCEDANHYVVSLLETMVQPQSLRDKGPINCIPTPKENAEAWYSQKDITGVLSGVPNNTHYKCCTFDSPSTILTT